MGNSRWETSVANIVIFGSCYIALCLLVGYVLAVLLDQKIRGEALLRTIYLSPQAMSLIVTGLVWAWFLNPDMGLQGFVRGLGWESFSFAWLASPTFAIYAVVIAGGVARRGPGHDPDARGTARRRPGDAEEPAGRRRAEMAGLRAGRAADPDPRWSSPASCC